MSKSPCPCRYWATDDAGLDALLGHHHACAESPDITTALRGLIRQLCDGIDAWAADCDGVHPAAWDAYRKAKLLCGVVVLDNNSAMR